MIKHKTYEPSPCLLYNAVTTREEIGRKESYFKTTTTEKNKFCQRKKQRKKTHLMDNSSQWCYLPVIKTRCWFWLWCPFFVHITPNFVWWTTNNVKYHSIVEFREEKKNCLKYRSSVGISRHLYKNVCGTKFFMKFSFSSSSSFVCVSVSSLEFLSNHSFNGKMWLVDLVEQNTIVLQLCCVIHPLSFGIN